MNEFDLTTRKGLTEAADKYIKDPDLKLLIIPAIGPFMYLGKKVGSFIIDSLPDTNKVINAQKETAEAIIKAGKAQGASKLKMKINQKAGADIGANIDGVSTKFEFGSSGEMVIEVEYK